MPARNFAATRHSGLSQITLENASRLRLAWTFSAGVIMWVPAGMGYLVAALAVAATWLREPALQPAFDSR